MTIRTIRTTRTTRMIRTLCTARRLLPVLAATFVVTLGGTVMADATITQDVQATDFDSTDGVLAGYHASPNGRALGFYQHTEHTNHGIGNPGSKDHPPSPCFGLTHAWNNSLRKREHAHIRTQILAQLAAKQCFFNTDVSVDSTDPANPKYILLSITPNQP